jgi:hypothetical protein
MIRGNAHATVYLRTINQFLKLVYLRTYTKTANILFMIKNKSRQGITIRKNKQPVSIGQSSNSHVNRTDSAHSINARSASNMIPCFPANNSTDVHHCDIVSSRSSPSHFTKRQSFSYVPSQNQVNYKKIKPLLGTSKRIDII